MILLPIKLIVFWHERINVYKGLSYSSNMMNNLVTELFSYISIFQNQNEKYALTSKHIFNIFKYYKMQFHIILNYCSVIWFHMLRQRTIKDFLAELTLTLVNNRIHWDNNNNNNNNIIITLIETRLQNTIGKIINYRCLG